MIRVSPGKILVFLAMMAWSALPLSAAQDTGKFVFYYQTIEKAVQLEPETPPQGFWEKTKALVNKGLNFVRKYSEIAFNRCLFPGEGKKRWYSLNSSKRAYDVRRTKVRDEKHLLELMGAADGDLSKLTNGQLALLEVYRNASNPTLRDLSTKALAPRIIIHLSDTTGFDGSSEVRDDFWPMSMGLNINMPSGRFNYTGGGKDAVGTMVHETAHCTNMTLPSPGAYGLDGHHFQDELTKPSNAYQEAWAEYQEMLFDPDQAKSWADSFKTVSIEDKKVSGKYEDVPFSDPRITASNMFAIEAVNAWILYRLATEIPDGRAKVQKAFSSSNRPWGNMERFLKAFGKQNPGQAAAIHKILAEVSSGKLSAAAITKMTGVPAPAAAAAAPSQPLAARAALSERGSGATPVPGSSAPNADLATLQKRYEEAYQAYVRAIQAQDGPIEQLKNDLRDAGAALDAARRR